VLGIEVQKRRVIIDWKTRERERERGFQTSTTVNIWFYLGNPMCKEAKPMYIGR
jgi:hypothetical protein